MKLARLSRLTLTVSLTSVASLSALIATGCEPPPENLASSSPQTSRLGLSADGKTLYVVHADHDLVRAIDAATGDLVNEVAVAGHPHRLTVLQDGRVAVTSRYAGTVSVVNVERGEIDSTVEVGSDPHGVIEVDGALLVAVSGEGDLARVSLDGVLESRIALEHGDPRGLVRTADGKVIVSHFTSGALSVVVDGAARKQVDMRLPSKRFFFPTQMDTLSVSSDGTEVAVPHVECNNDPAQFGAGGTDLGGSGVSVEYYVTGPTGFPAVVPTVSTMDPVGEELLSDEVRTIEEATLSTSERPGAAAPVINPIDRNLLMDTNVAQPAAVAWVGNDELQLVVNRGSGNVIVRRPRIHDGQSSIIAAIDVGVGADSVQVSPDGRTAYVFNAFDDSIRSFPIPLNRVAKSRYAGDEGSGQAWVTRAEPLDIDIDAKLMADIEPVLPLSVRNGRVLFHAVSPELTRMGAISCASCHPGGGDDGTTWSFAEGPRQSPALWGGILGSEPFHWDQAVQNMADISRVTIQGRMGGTGLGADAMNDIGAFLNTIPAPAPPRNADFASVERGEALFFDVARLNCTECHAGARFTDNEAHDVGTGVGYATRETQNVFATPVLFGLAHSAPYLHDGSAATLEELVETLVVTGRMGKPDANLTEQDKADLVAFLKTL